MKENALQPNYGGLMKTISTQIQDDAVTEVTYKINKEKGILSVHGKKNGEIFRSTQELYNGFGIVQNSSSFHTITDRTERATVVKELRQKGYKQQEIADMLGISQAQVSIILNS